MGARLNPNLDRYMEDVNRRLIKAQDMGDHAHAGVRVGIGATQTGPVLAWEFNAEDQDDYGFIEIRNYEGTTVRKPLSDVIAYDVRACWDRCAGAPEPPAATPDQM